MQTVTSEKVLKKWAHNNVWCVPRCSWQNVEVPCGTSWTVGRLCFLHFQVLFTRAYGLETVQT